MRKVCVFGSDGRTGVRVVNELIKSGYEVIACVYKSNDSSLFNQKVETRECDILEPQDVQRALEGADAVISVIGHIKNSNPQMQTIGTRNILESMKNLGIMRVISLTGTGVRIPNDKPSLIDCLLNFAIKFIDPERINDGVKHAKLFMKSNVNWTIVRVLKLTNQNYRGSHYRLSEHGPVEIFTPRKKVAKIMVDLLTDDGNIKKLPVVSS